MATKRATASAIRDAHCAFIFNPPSSTNSVTIGSAAKIDETPSEFPTGSRTCLYMGSPPACPAHPYLSPPVGRGTPPPPAQGSDERKWCPNVERAPLQAPARLARRQPPWR